MNLLSTLNLVTTIVDNGEGVCICFMEIRKAFNIVNPRIICANLATLGVSP